MKTILSIVLGVFGFGASWMTVRGQRVATGSLAACVGSAPLVVHARGVALEAPVLRDRAVGSMAPFDHRAPSTYFAMQVGALVSRDGVERPVRGELLVRVEETVTPFRAGDAVEARGLMYPPAPLLNPGGFDSRRFARSRGRAGLLSVPRRGCFRACREPTDRSATRCCWRCCWGLGGRGPPGSATRFAAWGWRTSWPSRACTWACSPATALPLGSLRGG